MTVHSADILGVTVPPILSTTVSSSAGDPPSMLATEHSARGNYLN